MSIHYTVGAPALVIHSGDRGTHLTTAVVVAVESPAVGSRSGQRVTFRRDDGSEVTWSGGNLNDYAEPVRPTPDGAWAVLSVDVTRVLGRYPSKLRAMAAAAAFGGCSFAYELSPDELARLAKVGASL